MLLQLSQNPEIVIAVITGAITVLVALSGYLFTYFNTLVHSKRQEQLDRINKQLADFYGPLLSITESNNEAWVAFQKKYSIGVSVFSKNRQPSEEELKAWRLWMMTVFMPNNLRLYEIVVSKTDLIIESEMPECLLMLCAHVSSYKTILKRWEAHDYSDHAAVIGFPQDLLEYSQSSFKKLKVEQAKLLGRK